MSAFVAYLATNSVKTNMLIGFKTTTNQDIFIQPYKILEYSSGHSL